MAKAKMLKLEPEVSKGLFKMGVWSFLIGIVISVLAGIIIKRSPVVIVVLVLLGFLVGFLNVTAKEAVPFLVSTIALVVAVSGLSIVFSSFSGGWVEAVVKVLDNVTVFVAPAALFVALKSIYVLASD